MCLASLRGAKVSATVSRPIAEVFRWASGTQITSVTVEQRYWPLGSPSPSDTHCHIHLACHSQPSPPLQFQHSLCHRAAGQRGVGWQYHIHSGGGASDRDDCEARHISTRGVDLRPQCSCPGSDRPQHSPGCAFACSLGSLSLPSSHAAVQPLPRQTIMTGAIHNRGHNSKKKQRRRHSQVRHPLACCLGSAHNKGLSTRHS